MLYRSDDNLEQGAISFIENNNNVILFSAYLKLDALKRINKSRNIKQIVVRWEIEDLCKKVSDINLYHYCIENNIVLYRNTKIHLKTFWNNNNSILFGSANITSRGIGQRGGFNFELNGIINNISFTDKSYLNKIILESEYVTEDLFDKLKKIVDETELPVVEFPKLPTPPPTVDYFLINQLPMASSPELLYEIYKGNKFNDIEMNCAAHDLELYRIKAGLSKEAFITQLKTSFNKHPFIVKFKAAVQNTKGARGRTDRNGSMNFGAARIWFSDNTTTVPTPRTYELNNYVEILYGWICYFDDDFTWNRPNHTQVIYYKLKN